MYKLFTWESSQRTAFSLKYLASRLHFLMNKTGKTLGPGSQPKMVRGNSNFFLVPFQIKKSVMMMRKQRRVLSLSESEPEKRDLDIFQDSLNFPR